MMTKKYFKENFVGKKYGHLQIISAYKENKKYLVICKCDCGKTVTARQHAVLNSNTKSCGCFKLAARPKKHGMKKSPEYSAWQSMKDRCLNKKNRFYDNYGGRGITVCTDWINDFSRFFRDVGERPSKAHSLDRIDNDGNYEPSNCRWSLRITQNNNRRNNVRHLLNGEMLTLVEIEKKTGVNRATISSRMKLRGITAQEAAVFGDLRSKKTKNNRWARLATTQEKVG